MSSSIWTECAGSSEIGPLRGRAWRAVEGQHQISTRKLVDSLEEHELLEAMLEAAKPPTPPDLPRGGHYLLTTPFRYPPLRHGSRFGTRRERGIWYGAETLPTTFAEVAYYRLVFLEGTSADLGLLTLQLTAFNVGLRTARGVDLDRGPFRAFAGELASPTSYRASQAVGSAMREAGVGAFRYRSARDPGGGVCVGVFEPAVFVDRQPTRFQTWAAFAERARVDFRRDDRDGRSALSFVREDFLVEGVLPSPAA